MRQLDPNTPVIELQPVSALVDQSVAEPRFRTVLLTSFALTSVFLAAVGIFGVLSYAVSERTREIGIRMALGAARQRTIFRDVLAAGGSLVAVGSVLGLGGGVALTRWIRGLLFQVSPAGPLTLAAATLGLVLGHSGGHVDPGPPRDPREPGDRPAQLRPMSAVGTLNEMSDDATIHASERGASRQRSGCWTTAPRWETEDPAIEKRNE